MYHKFDIYDHGVSKKAIKYAFLVFFIYMAVFFPKIILSVVTKEYTQIWPVFLKDFYSFTGTLFILVTLWLPEYLGERQEMINCFCIGRKAIHLRKIKLFIRICNFYAAAVVIKIAGMTLLYWKMKYGVTEAGIIWLELGRWLMYGMVTWLFFTVSVLIRDITKKCGKQISVLCVAVYIIIGMTMVIGKDSTLFILLNQNFLLQSLTAVFLIACILLLCMAEHYFDTRQEMNNL